jgi:elongation factor G
MKAMMWRGETQMGEDYHLEEIPAEMADQAAEYREKLIETLAEADDDIMHMYLEGEEPSARSRSRPASAGPPSPAS